MTQPSESPQISFRDTATPPRFAGLTLPSALRELCAQSENATSKTTTPRRTDMSVLATRLRKIRLDTSPTDKGSLRTRDALSPSRLDFDDEDVDKENVVQTTSLVGTAVWGVHDSKDQDGVKEKENVDAIEEAALKGSSHISGNLSDRKNDTEQEEESGERAYQLGGEGPETESSNVLNAETDTATSVQTERELSSKDADTDGSGTLAPKSNYQSENKEQFEGNLQKILDGKHKWSWLERCKAIHSVTESLSNNPTEELVEYTKSVLGALSSKLNDHLDELRPSVITSALGLVNAVISLNVEGAYSFAEGVFPSIMDLACGRSLTAQEAAKSLALALHHHSELQSILGDADNIDRLRDILQQQATSLVNPDFREYARLALEMVQGVASASDNIESSLDSDRHETVRGVSTTPPTRSDHSPETKTPSFESSQMRISSFRGRLSGRSTVASAQNSAHNPSRNSIHLPHTPGKDEPLPRSPSPRVGDASVEVRNGATVIRNAKLRGSARKLSPGSMRKQRMYSEEEVEELRRKAVQAAREEASQVYEKEKEHLTEARDALEHNLKTETSQVEELKTVLEEYQLTMQTMVAHGNTKISAQNTALVNERNRLKAELLEVSESFETLKEKYEDSKKAVDLFEAKENRFIEQIKELKKNMIELQKWSNDLKANTEKKLSKAFESVTSYRASYIDKEAHAEKAISDLERTRTELEREQQSHAQTAAKFSQVETQLHSEQDARSSAEASLATTKATLSRITSQKERLQSDLDAAKDSLSEAKAKVLELEGIASRASEIQSQLDSAIVENQSLKARAYDDMTRIKSLEVLVKEKDAELEEMGAICEEAMERLERGKLNGT